MPAQQLLLSWKDHNGALVSVFENLLKKNSLVDCTLAAEGQYLKAHKVVLSACSSYFELLFSQESEKNPIVILKDVKFQELEAAVNFMYRGEVEVCEDRLAAFLEVADSLQIKGLGSDGKSQDSKEKVSSVKSSSSKSAVTRKQQFRKEDSSSRSDNAGQSSNVPANCEQIRNNESSSVHQSSQRGSSPALTVTAFNVGSPSCADRKETFRDSGSLESIRQSSVLPSFPSGESVQCEGNPVIKTEPETDTFVEDQSDEAERDFGDDVTTMDDQDDWDEPNTETMDAVPTNQQDIGYKSEHMKTENSISENVECIQSGNQSSSEGAGWMEPDVQHNFSSVFVKEEPGTSASWNPESVAYDASPSGDEAGPSAGTSDVAAGMDNLVIGDNDPARLTSVKIHPPVCGSCRFNFSGNSALQRIMVRRSSEKMFCPRCQESFNDTLDRMLHECPPSCGALLDVSVGELPPKDPSLQQPPVKQRRGRRSSKFKYLKCHMCDYKSRHPHELRRHTYTHKSGGISEFENIQEEILRLYKI